MIRRLATAVADVLLRRGRTSLATTVGIVVMLLALVSATHFELLSSDPGSQDNQTPVFRQLDDVNELTHAVDYQIQIPTSLPDGCELTRIGLISNSHDINDAVLEFEHRHDGGTQLGVDRPCFTITERPGQTLSDPAMLGDSVELAAVAGEPAAFVSGIWVETEESRIWDSGATQLHFERGDLLISILAAPPLEKSILVSIATSFEPTS